MKEESKRTGMTMTKFSKTETNLKSGLTIGTLEIAFVAMFETNVVLQLLLRDTTMIAVLKKEKKSRERPRIILLLIWQKDCFR